MNKNSQLLVLVAIGLLLTACSGFNVNNHSGLASTDLVVDHLSGDLPDQEESKLSGTEHSPQIEEDSGTLFSPTSSPISEQNYGSNELSDRDYSDLEIVTLLPEDAIPALSFPEYYSVKDANQEYMPDEMVIGVEFNGDSRAYSVSLLSRHEIVNDTIGGIHLAVTW